MLQIPFLILVALGVIAGVLGAASSRQSPDTSVERSAGISAQIVNDFTQMSQAVATLASRGVEPSDILFNGAPQYGAVAWPAALETDGAAGSLDATAERYQIFHPSYGTVTPAPRPPSKGFSATTSLTAAQQNYVYVNLAVSTNGGARQLGSSASDRLMIMPDVAPEVCQQINARLHGDRLSTDVTTAFTDAGAVLANYMPNSATGTTTASGFNAAASGDAPRMAGCLRTTAGDARYFAYQVLIVR